MTARQAREFPDGPAGRPPARPVKGRAISLRVSGAELRLIDRAARALGKSRTAFLLEAAAARAQDVLLDRRHFPVDEQRFAAFQAALDAPPADNPALRALLQAGAPWEEG